MYKKYLSILAGLQNTEQKPLSHRFNSKTLIVDGMNTFLRAFAVDNKHNYNGHHIGGIASFLKSVGYAVRNENPSRVVIVFDGEGGYINRRYLYPEYKKNRENLTGLTNKKSFQSKYDEDEAKFNELERLIEYLQYLPITLLGMDKTEADDIMAYATKVLYEENTENEIVIMSSDQDFLQLVNDRVTIYSPTKKKHYYAKEVSEEFKCLPENYLIYKTFLGDTSDNIKGVNGVGETKIHKLFPDMFLSGSLTYDKLYEVCSSPVVNSVLYEKILNSKQILDINYRIMNLSSPDLSDIQKSVVVGDLNKKPTNLRKFDFIKMWHMDKMNDAIPHVESWVNLFAVLNNN